LLELHSPDGQHTVVLRCKDGATANSWFTAIHTNIAALLPQTLAHINAYLGASSAASTHPHLKHIGWLAEQVRSAVLHLLETIFSCLGAVPTRELL
ncbi:Beta-2-syntrophin, partial [Xenoophorus captivus]